MNPIIIVLIVVIIIILIYSYPKSQENFTNDEAIQNVASLYNSGMATVTNLNATGSITTPKIQLGNKWVLSGATDTSGNNDSWLRLLGPNGQYYGGLAAGQLYVAGAYQPDVGAALNDLNNRLNAANTAITNLQNNYVKKGPINLVASYVAGYGNNAGTNVPVRVSDNYNLRSWNPDGTANNLASQLSIL